ncbi:MAG: hypothetical protein EA376_04110 [Phycisphaeraceae bacterium]|nr:MAG: hypothetical protein EA376_04110 [Phycisphaeraceae bacterium]
MSHRDAAKIGAIRDESFEPEAAGAFFIAPLSPEGRFAWIGLTPVMAAGIWMGLSLFGVATPEGPTLWGSPALAGLAAAFLFPTYIRISPGKLDVIRHRAFGIGKANVESYSLRDSRVVVDFKTSSARLYDPGLAIDPHLKVNCGGLPGSKRLLKQFLRGAVSTAEAPELEGDPLVG